MNKDKLWSIVKLLLKVGITGLSLYLVFKKVNPQDVKSAFTTSNPLFLLCALIFFVISQIISSSRLNTFFKGIGLNIAEGFNFRIYLLGMFYNLFLPGGIGGDGYKVFLLKKRFKISARKLVWAIFFDRLSGLWALGLIISALIFFLPHLGIAPWIPVTALLAGSIIYYFAMQRFFKNYCKRFILTHFKALLVQSMQIISVIFLLYALHFDGKFSPYLFMFLVSSLVAIFPFTVGGLGAREIVFIYGADILGYDEHVAVMVSLLFYFISAILSFTGIYFVFQPQKLGNRDSMLSRSAA
ncbi:MAG TPA: lysylphosphatidylglycerol synthase transmembrane domain-containing protein [Sphingobacteriaceae bacterium]|nr:lysylphosphatidylglycerol synthase transmembrane domain-containing protein [Sphingobacteriaceae bacterium]